MLKPFHRAYPRRCLRFFNRDLLYGPRSDQALADICPNVGAGLFRGRPRFGIINTVSTWITRIGYLLRAIYRDTTVLAYRKRFLPTINTETGAHRSNWFRAAILCAIDRSRRVPQRGNGQRCWLVFETIKILTRYGMDAKSFSVWRVYRWWNKLAVPVSRYFFLFCFASSSLFPVGRLV